MILFSTPVLPHQTVWRNYEEVFDLALLSGSVYAATNGGLLCFQAGRWTRIDSPGGLRSIQSISPLAVNLADGQTVQLNGNRWVPAAAEERKTQDASLLNPGDGWPLATPPPPSHAYVAMSESGQAFAGTASGLYQYRQDWLKINLPSDLPVARPNGFGEVKGVYVVGGIDGLFVGRPGHWKQACSDSIRQVLTVGESVWVVHGNGAVDNVQPSEGKIWPDILYHASKRPWSACVGRGESSMLFGGLGGWVARGAKGFERYLPELQGDVIQGICERDGTLWVATEKSGLLRFNAGNEKTWNPGNGLIDPNVTSFLPFKNGAVIGTAHSGLFKLLGDSLAPIDSPTQRVTAISEWHDCLVLGGMDGCWLKKGAVWQELSTFGEETTSVNVLNNRLVVTTASGVYFFDN